jgi:hypothetical protein
MTDEELEEFMDWLDARARERQERQRRMAWPECYGKEANREATPTP